MQEQSPEGRFPELVATARTYCALIDQVDRLAPEQLIESIALLLPRLHATVRSLPKSRTDGPLQPLVNLETRFALFRRIRDRLGERDPYWMEYDHAVAGQAQSGSLADDLTDIYFDLRRGLQRLDEGSPSAYHRAVSEWCRSYELHWGEHLVDAERHLFHLMRGRLRR